MDAPTTLDPEPVAAFIQFLGGKDPKTIAAYCETLRSFIAWLATMPEGNPLHRMWMLCLAEQLRHLIRSPAIMIPGNRQHRDWDSSLHLAGARRVEYVCTVFAV
jgi:hypothetical protein